MNSLTASVFVFIILTFANQSETRRIVGGRDAADGEFPYQVSLRQMTDDRHFCGGSIISNRWILTAAHCISRRPELQFRFYIIVGAHLLSSGGTRYEINRQVVHQGWNPMTVANDIAVAETANPITFTSHVQPIALATVFNPGGVNSILTGWGGIDPREPIVSPNNLQVLPTTTLTNFDCQSRVPLELRDFIFDHKICTFTRIGQGACNMDSGGPLAANNEVIGIVSWTPGGCADGSPDIFDRVHFFRSWILQETGIN